MAFANCQFKHFMNSSFLKTMNGILHIKNQLWHTISLHCCKLVLSSKALETQAPPTVPTAEASW